MPDEIVPSSQPSRNDPVTGKFMPGHIGRNDKGKTNRKSLALRKQALRYMTLEKMWDLCEMLYVQAIEKKDVKAAKELLDRVCGKPKQELEHSLGDDVAGMGGNAMAMVLAEIARVKRAEEDESTTPTGG